MDNGSFFFQAEDGIRDLVRSRGVGDVYKRQAVERLPLELLTGLPALLVAAKEGSATRAAARLDLSLIHI